MRLPLNFIPAFLAVADHGTVRAAAEALNLTQSAVSQQLSELENRLGFTLFERRGRNLVLNPAGDMLRRSVSPALQQIEDGVRAAQLFSAPETGAIRITMSPAFAQRWFLPRLSRWRKAHPGVILDIDSSTKVIDLQREGFHAAVRVGHGPWPGTMAEILFDEPTPFIAVCSPTNWSRLARLEIGDLAHEPLLGDAMLWDHWFAAAQSSVKAVPVASFNDVGLMLQASERGLGIAVVRELLAADALADGRLSKLFDVFFVLDHVTPYQLVYPRAFHNWAPLIALKDWIRTEFRRPPSTPD